MGTKWLCPTSTAGMGRRRGLSSSTAVSVSVTGSPALTERVDGPSTESRGASFPIRSGRPPVGPPAPKLAPITVASTAYCGRSVP